MQWVNALKSERGKAELEVLEEADTSDSVRTNQMRDNKRKNWFPPMRLQITKREKDIRRSDYR